MTDNKMFWFNEAVKYRTALKQIAALCNDCEHKENPENCLNYCRDISAMEIAREVLNNNDGE